MKFNADLIVGYLITALVTAEKSTVLAFLQSIHDNDTDLYKALVFLANYGLKKGAVASTKTTTTIDDQGVAAAQQLLAESASQNGITL